MILLFRFFAIAFSALFPLINPVGSALIFVGLVGPADGLVYKRMARKIAILTVLFLIAVDLLGDVVLSFFGVSLPVIEVAGGLVLASMGWNILNQPDHPMPSVPVLGEAQSAGTLDSKAFYPFTFPITADPATVVVTLALAAHAHQPVLLDTVFSQLGLFLAIAVLCLLTYFAYAYAPAVTRKISPQTAHGIARIISFLLLAIGVQIFWRGASVLLRSALH